MADRRFVALYCRLAREDDERIAEQQERLLRYAAEKGVSNTVLYIDNGESGSNLNRPAFSQMDADIKAGSIKTIILLSIDRIGRNIFEVGRWLNDVQQRDVEVISVDGTIGSELDGQLSGLFTEYLRRFENGGGKQNGA